MERLSWTPALLVLAALAVSATRHPAPPPLPIDHHASLAVARHHRASDAASRDFLHRSLPRLFEAGRARLDRAPRAPARLVLESEHTLRVYFVSERAGFHNALAVRIHQPNLPPVERILFPDASMEHGFDGTPGFPNRRSEGAPLLPGDFAELGPLPAGTGIEFLLGVDGARRKAEVFSTDRSRNPDGKAYAVAVDVPGVPHGLLGFEDLLGGGDQDFNDVAFAVALGDELRPRELESWLAGP